MRPNPLLEALQQLRKLRIGIIWVLDLVSDSPLVAVDFPVVSTLVSLVAKEVDLVVDDTSQALLRLNVSQAVGLVPASRENIERDLTTDGVCETRVGECFLELGDHGFPDFVLEIVLLVFVSLFGGGVTADGGDVDHAVAELDEGTALDGDVEISDVVKNPRIIVNVAPQPAVHTYHLVNCLYLSSPIHAMKLWLARTSPMRMAVSPFSAKQKSNSEVTSTGPPSCSCCLTRLEPPTKPMAHL